MKMSEEEYLAQFPEEPADTCFAQGGQTMYGREGAYYCANCDAYIGDIYSTREAPMKNELGAHCWACKEAYIEDY